MNRFRNLHRLSLLLAFLILPLACAHPGNGSMKTEVQDLQNRIYELQKRNAEAQVEIQEMKEGNGSAPSGTPSAPIHSEAEPAGTSQPDQVLVPGSTVDLGQEGPSKSGESVKDGGAAPPSQAPASPPGPNGGGASAETDKLYIDGYAQLNSGNYSKAEQEFGEFLARSPESDLADDAQYWMGECYFSQKDYHRAILEFRKVIDQYPFGNRVPHAFLKVGLSYLALGDKERAAENLETVVQAFPKSEVATVAKATLDEINKNPPH
jgi:tol-pal system protein YbgF